MRALKTLKALALALALLTGGADGFRGRQGVTRAPAASYFRTLGLAPSASPDEVRGAYKKLARKYHPDRNKDADAHDKFLRVSEAHEVLMDPKLRREAEQSGGGGGYSNHRYNQQQQQQEQFRRQYHYYQHQRQQQQHQYRQQQQQQQPPILALFDEILGKLPTLILLFTVAYMLLGGDGEPPRRNTNGGNNRNGNYRSDGGRSENGVSVPPWHLRRADLQFPEKPFIVVILTQHPLVTEGGGPSRTSRWVATLNAKHREDKVVFRVLSQRSVGERVFRMWLDFVEEKTPWSTVSPGSTVAGRKADDLDAAAVVVLRPSRKVMTRLRAPVSPDNFALLTSFVERLLDGQGRWESVDQGGPNTWPRLPV